MPTLTIALLPWIVVAVAHARRAAAPRKRGWPSQRVRDQITPEEREAHFDSLRQKRAAEKTSE